MLYAQTMTTTTNEDLTVITSKAIEQADELVKLATDRIADSKDEVEDLIAGLQERLDDENLAMTTRERNLLDLTIGALQHRANTLWRMSRG